MVFKVFREEICDVMPEFHKLYPNCEALKFNPIMVLDMLKLLNPYKSQGPDNINPYILEYYSLLLGMPLCLLFQKSLDLSMVHYYGNK